jgi:hypothetical protein
MRRLFLPRRGAMRPGGMVVVPPVDPVDPGNPGSPAADGGWGGLGEEWDANGVWVGATMPTTAPPGKVTRLADNFERTTLNDPARPNYWGTYNNSFSGANPGSSWWDGSLVTVSDGMLHHKQVVRTRAHKDGVVDRRIESGTSHLWGMPSGAYPQVTVRARTWGPFNIVGIIGTVFMLWPNGESWPALTEVDWLEDSDTRRGRSNFHYGPDWTNHQQTGFRNWTIPDTGTRTVFNTFTCRINPPTHPTAPYRNEVYCNGVLGTSWTPPSNYLGADYRQTWPMLQINQTESYCEDNDTPTWTGPTGKQIMDSLPTVPTDYLDIQWLTVHRPA